MKVSHGKLVMGNLIVGVFIVMTGVNTSNWVSSPKKNMYKKLAEEN